MSSSQHQIQVKGVDKTGGAFASIKNRAASAGASIQKLVGGAFAAAGAYLGFQAIAGVINELGHLSDIAQKTSTSVDELTRAATAFNVLGIQHMGVDEIGKAFDYMAKTTGRTGMAGFYQTIEELGKIPDIATRGQQAVKLFGDAGLQLMPLINGASTSTEALKTVVDAMPGVPQAAADAGKGAADAMALYVKQVKSFWLQGLSFIANKLNNDYTGDVRTAALRAGNYLEYYTKRAVSKCLTWWKKYTGAWSAIGSAIGGAVGGFREKGWRGIAEGWSIGWESGIEELAETIIEADKLDEERTKKFEKNYKDRELVITKFSGALKGAAKSSGDATGNKKEDDKKGLKGLAAAAKSLPALRNDLIFGGSNDALKMQLRGASTQNEMKVQTETLKQIADNTKKTAEGVEDQKKEEPLKVID